VPATHEQRRRRLADGLPSYSAEAVLVTKLVNVRYLTGFSGSSGAVLVLADGSALLATDGRYQDQAADECPDVERVITRSGPADLLARADGCGAGAVGFEEHDLTVAVHRQLAESFGGSLLALPPVVEPLRAVKDDGELALLREACRISDAALAEVLPRVRVGATERRVAADLEATMRRLGADHAAFDSIVAAGPNSAIPHHTPTDRPIARGDLLKIDFGALVDGYHADETRTFVVGAAPADWQLELHAAVAAAQAAGVAALEAGASGVDVDAAARRVLADAGLEEHFTHGLGHGVGLEIHEAPFLGPTSPDRLAAAVPVTVEPGVYLPGRGGVRIEDTLVVGTDRAESLTATPRDLLVLDQD
jgi:Xaa-Pro aminopeptidase